MAVKKIQGLSGIDNRQEDAALEVGGKTPSLHVRDAVNIDFTETGRIRMRDGIQHLSDTAFKFLWQSSLHGDCFAALAGDWVKVNPNTWDYEVLISGVAHGPIYHQVLNNRVVMCAEHGLYLHDGQAAYSLCLETPASPMAYFSDNGSILSVDYSLAISWLCNGQESALSESFKIRCAGKQAFNISLPLCLNQDVSHVRLYMTEQNGGELRQVDDYPISELSIHLSSMPNLGKSATYQHLSPMRSGCYLKLWRGRLITVQRNVLYFSEPMAFHLTDERYNFVQFPQRITFIEPVDGGIWVGQVDHVVFLRGVDLNSLTQELKPAARPIEGRSSMLKSDMISSEISQGSDTAIWLAENGYNIGTSQGQIVEIQSSHLNNICGKSAQLVGFGEKVIAVVN